VNIHKFAFKTYSPQWIVVLSVVSIVLLLSMPGSALAESPQLKWTTPAADNPGPKWSTSAMACVPNGSTTQNDMVQTSHGNARYTPGKTGDLYLICPFTDGGLLGSTVSTISLTLQSSQNIKASAVLREVSPHSGSIRNIVRVSNDDPCLGTSIDPYFTCTNVSPPQVLNCVTCFYYVQISLHRDSAADEVRVLGVAID
jgi:hypothetical protein